MNGALLTLALAAGAAGQALLLAVTAGGEYAWRLLQALAERAVSELALLVSADVFPLTLAKLLPRNTGRWAYEAVCSNLPGVRLAFRDVAPDASLSVEAAADLGFCVLAAEAERRSLAAERTQWEARRLQAQRLLDAEDQGDALGHGRGVVKAWVEAAEPLQNQFQVLAFGDAAGLDALQRKEQSYEARVNGRAWLTGAAFWPEQLRTGWLRLAGSEQDGSSLRAALQLRTGSLDEASQRKVLAALGANDVVAFLTTWLSDAAPQTGGDATAVLDRPLSHTVLLARDVDGQEYRGQTTLAAFLPDAAGRSAALRRVAAAT